MFNLKLVVSNIWQAALILCKFNTRVDSKVDKVSGCCCEHVHANLCPAQDALGQDPGETDPGREG